MAKEILKYMKKIIITLFIFCFLEFIALVIMTILYIHLNNDIGVIETTTQEVQQDNTNGDNNFIGRDGDIYGKTNN